MYYTTRHTISPPKILAHGHHDHRTYHESFTSTTSCISLSPQNCPETSQMQYEIRPVCGLPEAQKVTQRRIAHVPPHRGVRNIVSVPPHSGLNTFLT
ncbi:Protein arginine N-methyltransferase 1 [Fusarium oxysporum f. sp. albedinis]|nr:Protein arginine N-methyltransferase 1 [Fusarium oxysporum f. sp. albedinis]